MKKFITAIKIMLLKRFILKDEMYCAYHSMDLYFVLLDMDNWLREQIKYNEDELTNKQLEALEDARTMLSTYMEEHDIDFYHVD